MLPATGCATCAITLVTGIFKPWQARRVGSAPAAVIPMQCGQRSWELEAGSWKLGAGSWKLEEQRHTAHAANTRRKYTATKNEPKIVQMGWARAIAVVLVVV